MKCEVDFFPAKLHILRYLTKSISRSRRRRSNKSNKYMYINDEFPGFVMVVSRDRDASRGSFGGS